jgi:ABC-type xylose transport system permease subunit
MQSNGDNMGIGDKVILSAVIGGTAEALGGGKFANGAVTGAYVMMFNHLMMQNSLSKSLDTLSRSLFCSTSSLPMYF